MKMSDQFNENELPEDNEQVTLINVVGVVGLLMLFVGLYQYRPALALTVTGGLLLAGSVFGAWNRNR